MSKSMDPIFPKSLNVKQAVIATLAYFDLFGVPLTRSEISEYLFFADPDDKKIDMYLKESPLINFMDGYYALQRYPVFFQNFSEKRIRSKQYWKKVKRYQWLFSICPFIDFIGVCNSLPIRDIHDESDIDLFVVAKKGHLFTARLFLTLLTSIFFIRRHGEKVNKRFCLSFYVTDEEYNFEKLSRKPYDIYLAYWIKTLEPVSGNYTSYLKFIEANQEWLKPYFKNLIPRKRYYRTAKPAQEKWKTRLENWFGSKNWEQRFKKWQLERAQNKQKQLEDQSGTIISNNILKFHDQDIRDQVRYSWVERMNSIL